MRDAKQEQQVDLVNRELEDQTRAVALRQRRTEAASIAAAKSEAIHSAETITGRMTDAGNAKRFLEDHAADVRYVGAWKKWLTWDGRRWERDDTHQTEALILSRAERDAADALAKLEKAREAFAEDPKSAELKAALEDAAAWYGWTMRSQNANGISACANVAKTSRKVAVKSSAMDADRWLFNVRNGTIDLRTGTLLPHDPKDLISKLVEVDYDPDAACPTWDAFLDTAMAGDAELVAYLQRVIGYCMTGEVNEHAIIVFQGGGSNGKSTLFRILRKLCGDYGIAAPRDILFKTQDKHPTELATLCGARLAICNEVAEGAALDEAKVKDLTGDDSIACRRMGEDWWSFDPTHKFIVSGNYRPVVRGDDHGIWRRLKLVPWVVTIEPDKVDRGLPDKLEKELPGILNWALKGCQEWRRNGLQTPQSVLAATEKYRAESDLLGQFLEECCTLAPDLKVARAALRIAYERWCTQNGTKPMANTRLAGRLQERGVTNNPNLKVWFEGRAERGWGGIGLRDSREASKYEAN